MPCMYNMVKCSPNIDNFYLEIVAGQLKSIVLYKQDSLTAYKDECGDDHDSFELTEGPSWVFLVDLYRLRIDPPNSVSVVGIYTFDIGIWEITLNVTAPCMSAFLEGPVKENTVMVEVEEEVILSATHQQDDFNHSWETVCGKAQRVAIHNSAATGNAPIFVTYDENRKEIRIKPNHRSHEGRHLVLVQEVINSQQYSLLLIILVRLPTSIESHLVPVFLPPLRD